MSRPSVTGVLLAAALALAVLPVSAALEQPAFAAGKSEGKGKDKGKPEHTGKPDKEHGNESGRGQATGDAVIAAATAALIQSFFAGDLPSGYVKPEPLPPGIRKNLARGKPLPPGIAKRALPEPLLAKLPHLDGYRYYSVGRDVALVSVATGIVADILKDAF